MGDLLLVETTIVRLTLVSRGPDAARFRPGAREARASRRSVQRAHDGARPQCPGPRIIDEPFHDTSQAWPFASARAQGTRALRLASLNFDISWQIPRFPAEKPGTRGALGSESMAHVDPLIAHRPEFADTQPDLRVLTMAPEASSLARLKENATPLLIGAGVGAAAALVVAALMFKKQPS